MKLFLSWPAILCVSFFLSGCITVYETTDYPIVDTKFSNDIKLKLENFVLITLQPTQYHMGYSSASAYNYRTGSFVSGSGSYSGATYQLLPDEKFASLVKDIFESAGANIRTGTPEFAIEGRIGAGHFLWDSPAMWYRDAPIFIFAVCTFGMALSCERENDVKLIVYDKNGKRLKEYHSTAKYHAAGIGFPFALFANDKMYESYGDRMAAQFALVKCVNNFIHDYNTGCYKQSLSQK